MVVKSGALSGGLFLYKGCCLIISSWDHGCASKNTILSSVPLQILVNSGALSGAFLVLVFCRWWSILVLFLVLFWWSCFVDCGQFWCSFWCFFGARVL